MRLERMVGAETPGGRSPCRWPPPRPQLCACRWTCRPTTRASSSASSNPPHPAGTSRHGFARGRARQRGCRVLPCAAGLGRCSRVHLLWLHPWDSLGGTAGTAWEGAQHGRAQGAALSRCRFPCLWAGAVPRCGTPFPTWDHAAAPNKVWGAAPHQQLPKSSSPAAACCPSARDTFGVWGGSPSITAPQHRGCGAPAPAQSPAARSCRAVQSSRASRCTRGFGAAGRLSWVGVRADPSATQPSLLLLLPRLGVHGEGMQTDKLQGRELQNGDNC